MTEQRLHDGRRLRRTVQGGRVVTEILPPAVRGAAPPELPELAMPEPLWRPPGCPRPLVSVVVRTVGRDRRWLTAAVASALAQDGVSVEVVVVDDGAGVEPLDGDRIGWLALPYNSGLAEARARGVARCRGSYVRLLDDDDELPPGALAAQVAALRADRRAGAVAGLLEPMDGQPWLQHEELRRRWSGNPDALGPLVRDSELSLVPMAATMFRRAGLPAVPLDFITADDNAQLRLLLATRPRLAWVERPVLRYRIRQDSNSHGSRRPLTAARVGMARRLAEHELLARSAPRPRVVAYLDHRLETGGAQWAIMQLAQHLDRRLVTPVMVCSEASEATTWCAQQGIAVEVVPGGADRDERLIATCERLGVHTLDVAWAARLLTPRLCAAVPATVAHAQSTDLTWAGLDDPAEPCEHINRIIAVSQSVVDANPHLRRRAVVIPSPVDGVAARAAAVARRAVRASWGVTDDRPVVVWSGRLLATTKRADLLRELVEQHPEVLVVIAGFVSPSAAPAGLAEDWRTWIRGRRVVWYEALWPWQMPQLYAAADIYLSTSDLEGLSLSMLEAMAAGCLPVVTDVGGVRETVPVGCGCVVAPGEVGALDAALGTALGLPRRERRQQAMAGRHAVAALYDVREAARRHALLYWGEE